MNSSACCCAGFSNPPVDPPIPRPGRDGGDDTSTAPAPATTAAKPQAFHDQKSTAGVLGSPLVSSPVPPTVAVAVAAMAAVLAWRAVAIMIAIADRLVRNGGIAKRRVLGGDRRVGGHGRGAVRSGIGGHRLIGGHGGDRRVGGHGRG